MYTYMKDHHNNIIMDSICIHYKIITILYYHYTYCFDSVMVVYDPPTKWGAHPSVWCPQFDATNLAIIRRGNGRKVDNRSVC